MISELSPSARACGDAFCLGGVVGTITGSLPVVVALIPAAYYLVLLWETKTVQRIIWRLGGRRGPDPKG